MVEVEQTICGITDTSTVPVVPCSVLGAPSLRQPRIGDDFVYVTSRAPGAVVRVFDEATGMDVAAGVGPTLSLFGGRQVVAGDTFIAVQDLPTCSSTSAVRVSAGCRPGRTVPPVAAGPSTVAEMDYDFGPSLWVEVVHGTPTEPVHPDFFNVHGRIYYPTDGSGLLPGDKRPLVALQHGYALNEYDSTMPPKNPTNCTFLAGASSTAEPVVSDGNEVRSDRGYELTARLLASQGYVVIAPRLSHYCSYVNELGVLATQELLGEHLMRFAEVNNSSSTSLGATLMGGLDLQRVVLLGHSNGGGLVSALTALQGPEIDSTDHWLFGPDGDVLTDDSFSFAEPVRITGLINLAPTLEDSFGWPGLLPGQQCPEIYIDSSFQCPVWPVQDVSLLLITGGDDRETGQVGQGFYNRADSSGSTDGWFAAAAFVPDANHKNWNAYWPGVDSFASASDPIRLPAVTQQRVLAELVVRFVEAATRRDGTFRGLATGREFPDLVGFDFRDVRWSFASTGGVVDRFGSPSSDANEFMLTNTFTGFSDATEYRVNTYSGPRNESGGQVLAWMSPSTAWFPTPAGSFPLADGEIVMRAIRVGSLPPGPFNGLLGAMVGGDLLTDTISQVDGLREPYMNSNGDAVNVFSDVRVPYRCLEGSGEDPRLNGISAVVFDTGTVAASEIYVDEIFVEEAAE